MVFVKQGMQNAPRTLRLVTKQLFIERSEKRNEDHGSFRYGAGF